MPQDTLAVAGTGRSPWVWVWGIVAAAAAGGLSWWATLLLRQRNRPKTVRIEELWVYPIKSCKGHSMKEVELTKWGLKDDRRYVIVGPESKALTQRELPKMVFIHPALPTEKGLLLQALPGSDLPGSKMMAPVLVKQVTEGTVRHVNVWGDQVAGIDQGDVAASWLQSFLGKEGLRLLFVAPSSKRVVSPEFGVGETAFADLFPLLVSNQASLDDFNTRVAGKVETTLANWRPNIHISGVGPWEEEEIRALEIDAPHDSSSMTNGAAKPGTEAPAAARLTLAKPCARCIMTTVDPQTGQRQAEGTTLKTLRKVHSGAVLRAKATLHKAFFAREKSASEGFFGVNAFVEMPKPGLILKVGDTVRVQW
mmetsp:Transcript_5696/g.13377  ORF Transcript_5696/g.13377 Transcript_5696/m.13377 type:complete len:366 (-) Transcript_5696:97-1194(-)